LLARVDIPLPEDLITSEVASRKQALGERLQRSGNTMDEYLEATNSTAEQLDEQFEQDARRSVKAGFVLDKLATQEELGLDQEELAAYVTEQAYRMGVQPDQLARQLSERGQLAAVAADVLRGKAMTLLAERSKVTDESGRNVDIKAVEAEAAEAAAVEAEAAAVEAEAADEADEVAGDAAADDADGAGADGGEEPEA
jgi:trigger factor